MYAVSVINIVLYNYKLINNTIGGTCSFWSCLVLCRGKTTQLSDQFWKITSCSAFTNHSVKLFAEQEKAFLNKIWI